MRQTGFVLVDGDGAARIGAPPRHWAVCAGLVIVAQWSIQWLAAICYAPMAWLPEWNGWLVFLTIAAPYAAWGAAILYLSRRVDGRGPRALGLTREALAGAWPWVLAGIFAAMPIILYVARERDGWLEPLPEALLMLTPATLIQAGAEEVLFRGVILGCLAARYGARRGIFGSALLFALWHVYWGQPLIDLAVTVASTFVFGVTAGLLALRQGHLGGVIALHVAWNVAFGLWAGLQVEGDFWNGYFSHYWHHAWTLADLRFGALIAVEVLPLFIETILILAATKATLIRVLAQR